MSECQVCRPFWCAWTAMESTIGSPCPGSSLAIVSTCIFSSGELAHLWQLLVACARSLSMGVFALLLRALEPNQCPLAYQMLQGRHFAGMSCFQGKLRHPNVLHPACSCSSWRSSCALWPYLCPCFLILHAPMPNESTSYNLDSKTLLASRYTIFW